MPGKETKKAAIGASWGRIIKNRAFIGAFIANPEAAVAKYGLVLTEERFLQLGEIADKLFDHARETLVESGSRLHNDCNNNCSAFNEV